MENRFKGIKFCPDCSNMLKALEEDKTLIFQCRYCNYREKIEEEDEVDIQELIVARGQQRNKVSSSINIKADQYLALDSSMSRCQIQCHRCGHNESVFYITSDQNDYKLLKVYICAKVDDQGQPICGFIWNSDQHHQYLEAYQNRFNIDLNRLIANNYN